MTDYADIDKVLSELRHGHSCLLLNENSAGGMTGFVVVAAEHCESSHIAFMARQARGLVCLAMTPQRCEELELPLMVEGDDSMSPFTLSIEAATGIDTGISAADRARTVRVAVDAASQPADLVQPGHIFPIAAAVGGVLTRTAPAEAAIDLTTLAGLLPSAVFTEVLDSEGAVAGADYLVDFADRHELVVGQVSDLVTYRLANQKTISAVRRGRLESRYGVFEVTAYQDTTQGRVHLALTKGQIQSATPTLVRVHVTAVFRDLVGTTLDGHASWSFDASLKAIAESESGVLVLLSKPETAEDLLQGIDRLLGEPEGDTVSSQDAYNQIGMGAQILRDLGVGQIRLMGAPLTYNALAGFGLEVVDFALPPDAPADH
ncbi:MAG: bifunctional 3,4-dihydroxy-2-butanone-4-phosphate synthase/GTP cyclohydrolase II [Halieaceae bacterium]|jgi:3,4-dihydroxy 2-butanone 4-phosphate synthase/GTP cyclohydrolase II|nr:bifunctional 3,4-dihydroxy-2-butanone-4-phosphate synthase/GTP cyclohydrolase II [Halieaceae bacterium]MDG1931147.1 3,4-dihydroxy-2-butanone-4-phosphate synthase [Luminiphilus sp.]MDG2036964.1 3,4-dihydroxy-2-butanone-4-phosphate synthase [Luminiphilus sp.]|tara:strand:- start:2243 stop:3367 length:1125 start_codon:yes stop_codon:yes gene_type:complete